MDLAHVSLYRMLCLPEVPHSLLPSQPHFAMPLLESTVLQGTPLRKRPDIESVTSPNWRLRLPRIRPQLSLPEEATLDEERDVSQTMKTLTSDQLEMPLSLSPEVSLSEKPIRLRKFRGSCPRDADQGEMSFSVTPVMRRSAELISNESKERLRVVGENSFAARTMVNRSRVLNDHIVGRQADLANASEALLARKVCMKTHLRYRSQLNPSLGDPPKPPLRPRKYLKPIELKPTSDQLHAVYSCLSEELSSLIIESNGATPRSGENNYKCYIGPGNNSQLVLHLVRKRWFWTRVDDWEQADFIWTQNKQQSIIETFPKCGSRPLREKAVSQRPLAQLPRATRLIAEAERKKSGLSLISDSPSYTALEVNFQSSPLRLYNRLERNYQLTSKKRLYHNMKTYCQNKGIDVFQYLPLTFHVENGRKDEEFAMFLQSYQAFGADGGVNLWIIKPGEATNCGHGIHVTSDLDEIKSLISEKFSGTGRKRTYIIQKYIERPLLVHKRKFDIRCYGLLTCLYGHIQGYFYHDGYLRTSSKEFSLKNSSRYVHLTNDAVQKKSDDYGKYEHGNKLSYPEFQKYLEATFPGQVDFMRDIWPQIRSLVTVTFEATYHGVDPHRRKHTFEVLGYDFMVDEEFKVWLIEVNTNPCLALSSSYLARLIPGMLENAFRIVLDSHFPEPENRKHQPEWSSQPFVNKFELVFSSIRFAQETTQEDSHLPLSSETSDDSHSDTGN